MLKVMHACKLNLADAFLGLICYNLQYCFRSNNFSFLTILYVHNFDLIIIFLYLFFMFTNDFKHYNNTTTGGDQ